MMRKYMLPSTKRSILIALLLLIMVSIVAAPFLRISSIPIIGAVTTLVGIVGGKFPPFFLHNISNMTVIQTVGLFYDVNCSDIEVFDPITYYDNFSGFDIDINTGLINVTYFNNSFVGNHTIRISCSDSENIVYQDFNLTIIDSEEPPFLYPIGPQIAITDERFELIVRATDADGDNLTFGVNTTLFTINPITGVVNFTPQVEQVGNYSLNFTVFDGKFYDWEEVFFMIIRGPYCGDGSCNNGENCATCPTDCGPCPPGGGGGGGSGSGGGAGEGGGGAGGAGGGGGAGAGSGSGGAGSGAAGGSTETGEVPFTCEEDWACTEWSDCSIEGIQTRKCVDKNKCGTAKDKPVEEQNCTYIPTCFDGVKNGDEEGVDCGGSCKPCPSCEDNIQNQGEQGIDCGGPCDPCPEEKEFRPFGPFQFLSPAIPRDFPWLMLLIIALILIMTVAFDRGYDLYLRRLEFDEYRIRLSKYRRTQQRMYTFSISLSIILLISTVYYYLFSNDIYMIDRLVFLPIISVILTPIAVAFVLRRYSFYSYQMDHKQEMLNRRHKSQIRKLMLVEDELLFNHEQKLIRDILRIIKEGELKTVPDFYKELQSLYKMMNGLRLAYQDRLLRPKMDEKVKALIEKSIKDNSLRGYSGSYPEMRDALVQLKSLLKAEGDDSYEIEENFLFAMRQMSLPHIRSIIISDHNLVLAYNRLVEIYAHYRDRHASFRNSEKGLIEKEKTFLKDIQKLSMNPKVIQSISQIGPVVKVYNQFISLFNRYTKKHELFSQMTQPEESGGEDKGVDKDKNGGKSEKDQKADKK